MSRDEQSIRNKLRRATKVAEEHTRKTGTPVKARVYGDKRRQAITYEVQLKDGGTYVLRDINNPILAKGKG